MTIFEAPEYDVRKARRRKQIISVVVAVVVVVGAVLFVFRNWPEEHVAKQFFTALVNKDYETAYGIWIHDKDWKSKPPMARYPYTDFYRDWGPAGDWGPIHSFKIDGATVPRDKSGSSNGVVVIVTINERKEPALIFVDKDKQLSFSPFEVVQ